MENLERYDLIRKQSCGETMTTEVTILLSTRAEAWLKLCMLDNALKGPTHLIYCDVIWAIRTIRTLWFKLG